MPETFLMMVPILELAYLGWPRFMTKIYHCLVYVIDFLDFEDTTNSAVKSLDNM